MKTGGIELAYTVSARELASVRSKLKSKQVFRTLQDYPIISLYWRVILIALFPFVWIGVLLDRDDLANRGGEGVHWGAQRMIAGPEGLTLRRAARTTVYRWAAIRELRQTRRMLLLMVTSMDAIFVPRQGFASRSDERCFCEFVRDRIAEAATSSQDSCPPEREAPSHA